MKTFLVTVASIVLALVATLLNINWLVVVSTIVALAGAYAQYRDSLPFEFVFIDSMWQKVDNGFQIVIPKTKHTKSRPISTTFQGQHSTYEEVTCAVSVDYQEAVILSVNQPFSGKVIIK